MARSYEQLQRDFATLKEELAVHLSQFTSNPQPFEITTCSTDFYVPTSDVLLHARASPNKTISEDLRNHKTFSMDVDSKVLQPFDLLFRVRLGGLRVRLDGVEFVGKKDTVRLLLETNGFYEDYDRSRAFKFALEPLSRQFWYKPATGKIVLDSVVALYGLHNPPTPFSTWTVKILNLEDLKLDGLQAVEFEWIGRAYGKW